MTITNSTTPAPAANPFDIRRIDGADFEVYDTRTSAVLAVCIRGGDNAQAEADRLWHAELMAAHSITDQHAADFALVEDDEPELCCEKCGDILKPEAALDDGERVLCRPCFEDSLPDEPTPAQQAQRDAENEADMLDFITSSTPPTLLPCERCEAAPVAAGDCLCAACRVEWDALTAHLTAAPAYVAPPFAPNLLPLHPELLARAVVALKLAADSAPRELACEASLVADALARVARRPNTDGWGIRRTA